MPTTGPHSKPQKSSTQGRRKKAASKASAAPSLRNLIALGFETLLILVPTFTIVDVALALLVFPAGSSSATGVLHLLLEAARYHLMAGGTCVVVAALACWLLQLRWTETALRRGLKVITLASLAAMLASSLGAFLWQIPNREILEFPGLIRVFEFCVLGLVGLTTLALFRLLSTLFLRLRSSHPQLTNTRVLTLLFWAAVSLSSLLVAHVVAAPVYDHRVTLLIGLLSYLSLLLPLMLLLSRKKSRRAWPTPVLLSLLLLSFPLSQNQHARFVLFGHVPVAGAYGIAWRSISDWDGDGTTAWYWGGSDCAPLDPNISPLMREIPEDNIDQDCRGGDARSGIEVRRTRLLADCKSPARPLSSTILITIDALRADAINQVVSPTLYNLQRQVTNYMRAYPPSGFTSGTTLGIVTGRALSDLNPKRLNGSTLEIPETLIQSLHEEGLATAVLIPFDLHPAIKSGADLVRTPWLDPQLFGTKRQILAAALLRGALDFSLTGTAERPAFVWTHLPDLHAPYPAGLLSNRPELSPYDQGLSYVDAQLALFLQTLKNKGRLDETLIIITSDHGEQLGQRGREGHGALFFEEGIHVPLLIHAPGCRREVSEHPVSLLALREFIERMLGHSRSPSGISPSTTAPVIVEEAEITDISLKRAIIGERYKIIDDLLNGGCMGFDLESDPLERKNAWAAPPKDLSRLNTRYQEWLDAETR